MSLPRHARTALRTMLATLCLALVAAGCGGGDGGGSSDAKGGGGDATSEGTSKVVDGASLFASKCAGCHGEGGEGGVGPSLQATSLDEAGIAGMVTSGMGGMPSFEGQLSKEEIDAVAKHVATEIKQ